MAPVDADAWDGLVGKDDPFVEHAFLSLLERSGSVGRGSGWEPTHVTAWRDGRLVGALPLYLKTHSYGEYIFDWGWADAASRLGVDYYPKLVAMVPVTPVTGRRFLFAEGEEWLFASSFGNNFNDFVVVAAAWFRPTAGVRRAEGLHVCDVLA